MIFWRVGLIFLEGGLIFLGVELIFLEGRADISGGADRS